MSKKTRKRKVVVTSETSSKKVAATVTRSRGRISTSSGLGSNEGLIYNKQSYILMGVGFGLVVLGLILMTGGAMPDPNTWDPDIIYSFRRITLAPFLILAGLIVEIYAIFKK